jgi:hypothetical protein
VVVSGLLRLSRFALATAEVATAAAAAAEIAASDDATEHDKCLQHFNYTSHTLLIFQQTSVAFLTVNTSLLVTITWQNSDEYLQLI